MARAQYDRTDLATDLREDCNRDEPAANGHGGADQRGQQRKDECRLVTVGAVVGIPGVTDEKKHGHARAEYGSGGDDVNSPVDDLAGSQEGKASQ